MRRTPRATSWPARLACIGVLVLLGSLSLGCVGSPTPSAAPQTSRLVEIEDVHAVGPYLAAALRGAGGTLRFYFPNGGGCRTLVREGGRALYLPEGGFGSLAATRGEPRCEPVGVGSLAAWRDQLPRRRSRFLRPLEAATLRPAGSAPGVLLARGSFPLALELLISGQDDLVAILPDEPACRALLAARSGMLEYRAEGAHPLVLRERRDSAECLVNGIAIPLLLD